MKSFRSKKTQDDLEAYDPLKVEVGWKDGGEVKALAPKRMCWR